MNAKPGITRAWHRCLVAGAGVLMAGELCAHDGQVVHSAWADSPPKIDGFAGDEEWAGAASVPMPDSDRQLRILNDERFLYAALEMQAGDTNGIDIRFDHDHLGGPPVAGDDSIQIFSFGQRRTRLIDFFFRPEDRVYRPDESDGGTTDLVAFCLRVGDRIHIELKHPLASKDAGHDLHAAPGDTVGILIRYKQNLFPTDAEPMDKSTWGDLVLARPPAVAKVAETRSSPVARVLLALVLLSGALALLVWMLRRVPPLATVVAAALAGACAFVVLKSRMPDREPAGDGREEGPPSIESERLVERDEQPADEPEKTEPGPARIWFLEDTYDGNSYQPARANALDFLSVLDEEGGRVRRWRGIAVDAPRLRGMAVSPDGAYGLVCEDEANRLTRFSRQRDWSVSMKARSVDLSENGWAYVLTSVAVGDQGHLVAVDPKDGQIGKKVIAHGHDLVVDDQHKKIWVVGEDIQRFDRDSLTRDFQLDPIEVAAISVDFTSDGAAWVAERAASRRFDTWNRLLRISPQGEFLLEVELEGAPWSLAVDRADDSLWVTAGSNLLKFNSAGHLLSRFDTKQGGVVSRREADRSIWVTSREGKILRFNPSGQALKSIDLSSRDRKCVIVR